MELKQQLPNGKAILIIICLLLIKLYQKYFLKQDINFYLDFSIL